MNVTCPNCATIYRVDPAKVPEGGVRARCSVCSAVFAVRREGEQEVPSPPRPPAKETGATAPASTPQPVATAPRPPAPPSVAPAPAAPAAAGPAGFPPRPAGPQKPAAGVPASPAAPASGAAPGRPIPAPPATRAAPSNAAASAVPPSAAPRPTPMPAQTAPPAAPKPATPPPPAQSPASPSRPPSPAPAGGRPQNPFLSQDPALKAKRLARALISDMVVYHPGKRQEGLRDGNLKELFEEEIKKSWEEYAEQVGREIADSTGYFREALNEILAGGRQIF
jgi:predicted Zn finger-like uncharacterized protein